MKCKTLAVFLCVASVAHGEAQITFEQALSKGLENSPSVKEIAKEVSELRANGTELGLLSNPELSGEIRNPTTDADGRDQEFEVAVRQPLRLSNFGARQTVASLLSEVADVESKMKLVEYEQRLLLAYSKVWALQERGRYLEKLIKRTGGMLKEIASPNRQGLFPASTQKLVGVQQKGLAVELERVNAGELIARAALTKIVGVALPSGDLAEPIFPKVPEEIVADDEIPLLTRIRSKAALASELHRVARLDSFPQFTPHIAFDQTADGDDRIIVGLTIPLPLFDRNQPERIRAQAEEQVQLAAKRYLEDGTLQSELSLLGKGVRASVRQIKALREEVMPGMDQAYVAAEREVFAGQGSPLQLWQVLNETRDLQEQYLTLWIESVSSRVELSILTGTSFR